MTEPAAIEPSIEEHLASDGYRFRYRHWVPASTPVGYVVALHGIQSHSGWYEHSSSRLCAAGWDVRYLDRRGSGLNQRERGHAPHHERLIHDVTQVLRQVRFERDRAAPAAPVVLQGVSWGGKLAFATCGYRPDLVDALALLYPGLRPHVRPTWRQALQLKLAASRGYDRYLVPIPLDDPRLFTNDRRWQAFLRDDELALHHASIRFLAVSRELDQAVDRLAANVRCPTLVMLAGRDRIIDNRATRRFCGTLEPSRLWIHEYPQAAHTLEFEPNRDEIVDDLLRWLSAVSPLPAPP